MTKKFAAEINRKLFDKVAKIKLNDAAGIFGTTSKESMLQTLRKSTADLGVRLIEKQSYDDIMQAYEALASSIDSAGLTGLISEAELVDYYALIDKLWAAIEQEK